MTSASTDKRSKNSSQDLLVLIISFFSDTKLQKTDIDQIFFTLNTYYYRLTLLITPVKKE